MRASRVLCLCLLAPLALLAESKNPTDYPLRVHIFNRSETTFYYNRSADESKGEGRANLFENDEVHGVDFNFDCPQKLKASFGFETYPAKWKKPGQDLLVLLPIFGKSNAYFTCDIKTDVKNFVYFTHNGRMDSESMADFKAWMVRHDYDPEHGKDDPTRLQPAAGTASGASAPAPAATAQ
jgi:hypothetical protein